MKPETYGNYKPESRLFAVSTHGRAIVVNWQFTVYAALFCKEFDLSTQTLSSFFLPRNFCTDTNMEAYKVTITSYQKNVFLNLMWF